MLERSQLAIAIGMITLAGVIVVIVYVRMIKNNTDRFTSGHPKSDTQQILGAIEGARKNISSNHDDVKADLNAVRLKLRWLKDWADRMFRMKE